MSRNNIDLIMTADINKKVFDENTLLKLAIFRECFREWFPVFLYTKAFEKIFIMDMFAGSGKDPVQNFGSPLILLDEVRGGNSSFCSQAKRNGRHIQFWFNEAKISKTEELNMNVDSFIRKCEENCNLGSCYFRDKIKITADKFENIFSSKAFIDIASNKKYAKFLVLDQYGFKQVGDEVFKKLIEFPSMDFIFFISSSSIKRFKEQESVKKYIDSSKIDFDENNPKLAHREIADYYRSLVPKEKEYYIHHFSLLKGSNRYGLIFGSNHTYGMEKFLRACWKHDPYSGETLENINGDHLQGELFYEEGVTVKKEMVKKEIRNLIRSGKLDNNLDGLIFTLKNGCEGDVFKDVMNEFKNRDLIQITSGKWNESCRSIHLLKKQDKVYTFKWKGR